MNIYIYIYICIHYDSWGFLLVPTNPFLDCAHKFANYNCSADQQSGNHKMRASATGYDQMQQAQQAVNKCKRRPASTLGVQQKDSKGIHRKSYEFVWIQITSHMCLTVLWHARKLCLKGFYLFQTSSGDKDTGISYALPIHHTYPTPFCKGAVEYRSEGLRLLQEMLSLGAWRMGLGGSGNILKSPSPSSPNVVAIFDEHLEDMGSDPPPHL